MAGRRLEDLGTPALPWTELAVLLRYAPPTSALVRELQPELANWVSGRVTADLLATIADLLANGNWQRQGKKNAPKPKPIKRPGAVTSATRYGSDPIPVKDFDDWWDSKG